MTGSTVAAPSSPRLAFLGVFGAGLLCLTALGATMPVLPRYVTGPLGAGNVAVGVTIGAFAIGAVAARPFAGRVADARGRRIVLVAGAGVMGLGGGLLFLPMTVAGLVGARLVVGVGEALVFTAGATWVVDLAPSGRRAQSIGLFGLAVWTGLSLGTVAGEGLYALAGFGAVWAFAALAPLVGAVIAMWLPDPHRPPAPSTQRAELVPRVALRPGVALALASAGYATMASFVVLHLAETGAGGGAAVFTTFTAAVVGARAAVRDRRGHRGGGRARARGRRGLAGHRDRGGALHGRRLLAALSVAGPARGRRCRGEPPRGGARHLHRVLRHRTRPRGAVCRRGRRGGRASRRLRGRGTAVGARGGRRALGSGPCGRRFRYGRRPIPHAWPPPSPCPGFTFLSER
jgi:MFS family permease